MLKEVPIIKKIEGEGIAIVSESEKHIYQEIDDLKQRLYDLENSLGIKGIEKRLQALETIVVDSDYQLSMKFKRELEEKTNEYRSI